MKKVLYMTTIATTINAFLVPHIRHLVRKGYKVDVATNIDTHIDEDLLKLGVRVFQVQFQRNPSNIKNKDAYEAIKKLQDEEKYDIVHVHTPVASFVTRLALKNYSVPKIIYTCHGFHFYKGGPFINWLLFFPLEKLAAKWTDCIVTINNEDFEITSKFKLRNNGRVRKTNGVGIEKEKYIIAEFNKNEYKQELKLSEDDFVILVLAELNKNKNHIQLIKAMDLLNKKYPNIKVLFAGSGPLERQIKNNIKKYNLEDKVQILGWRDDINQLINLSDIVGLFSKREGLGKCLLEAMVCGKSIIATNTRGPRELISNNENGFLFELNDYKKTSISIENIYLDKNLKNKFELRGIEKAKNYLLENVLDELDNIYTDIIYSAKN